MYVYVYIYIGDVCVLYIYMDSLVFQTTPSVSIAAVWISWLRDWAMDDMLVISFPWIPTGLRNTGLDSESPRVSQLHSYQLL